ncbi:MAG: AsmA family protein [Steroidobacteraceae bacterium]
MGFGILLLAVVSFAWLFDWNALRGPLARRLSRDLGRTVTIHGDLQAHLWSMTPSFSIGGLDIANPPWARVPQALSVEHLFIQVSLKELLRGKVVLPQVVAKAPHIDIERRLDGTTNWSPPAQPASQPDAARGRAAPRLPALQRLLIEDGHIMGQDAPRKLVFEGTLHADDAANPTRDGQGPASSGKTAFEIRSHGTLNGRPFEFIAGGPALIVVGPDRPYRLNVEVSAGNIRAEARINLDKPFDLARLEAVFRLSGNDLADSYYLTGLVLPNTGAYLVKGTLVRRGRGIDVRGLQVRIGDSDIRGEAGVDTGADRPRLHAKLTSDNLDLKDLLPTLGPQAPAQASLSTAPAAPQANGQPAKTGHRRDAAASAPTSPIFSDAELQVRRVRSMDADVEFHGASVKSRIAVRELALHLKLDDGRLRLQPLSFVLEQGRLSGEVSIDARQEVPETHIDLSLNQADLSQFRTKAGQSPLSGPLLGRMQVHGRGSSAHRFVSNLAGDVSVAVPRGEIRAAFAELTGIDVARGLGLLITGNQQRAELRCAVVAFQAHQGQLQTRTMIMDTEPVLLTGHGGIDLAHERLDLWLEGQPKHLRLLRLRSPIRIGGTLAQPTVGIAADKTLLQAGAATALGTLLTPLAAALAFIDPGLAKDANCASLLATATPPRSH